MARYSPEIAHNVPTAADPIENTSLAEILGAFSYALDLTEGQPAGHSIRACWIGTKIAQTIGLDAAQLRDVYYATLLKDLGCSSNAARVAHLFAGDDRHLKCQFKTIGPDAADFGRFILTEVGANAAPAVREAAVDHLMANAADVLCDVMSTRCTRGASIARQLRFSDDVATAILHLDEHWDGGGLPTGIAGTAIHIGARIALLAQVADVFFTQQGPRAAMVEIAQRRGTWFDPHLVDQFLTIAAAPHFWSPLASPSLETFLFSLEPAQSRVAVDEAYLDDIVSAFGQVIDAKSPYTSGHSERVGLFTDLIAQRMGIDHGQRQRLRRAAMLHDVGKLAVGSHILEKPGQLNSTEWGAMQRHAAETSTILSRIGVMRDLAMIAGSHHERLDGRGYPLGLNSHMIALETRIITVADIFDALTSDRPYRAALPVHAALDIMAAEVGTGIDQECFAALRAVAANGLGMH